MPLRPTSFALMPLGVAAFLGACKSPTVECTDPLSCTGVTSIAVTSPTVDTVMAVGLTATLSATAMAGSTVVPIGLQFAANPTSVATVTPTGGVVTGVAAGNVTITVSQTNNGTTGQLLMRVVDADLPAVTAAVSDTLSRTLRAALSNTPRSAVNGGLVTCAGHVGTGNLLALNTCLTNLTNVSSGGSAADSTFLSVLDVFFLFSKAQLQL
jgi:hypothetical protein